MNSNVTLLLQLRNAAMQERDELIRFNLRLIADELDTAICRFTKAPTADNLASVNGHWARGVRVLGFVGGHNNGSSGAGLREGALLAEAA